MPSSRNRCRSFDCAICKSTLSSPGPQLSELSFGKLFEPGPKTREQQQLLADQFTGYETACRKYDPIYGRVVYDCNKILASPCGHVFHSGCLREWYYNTHHCTTFYLAKCPYCNQPTALGGCIRLYLVECPVNSSSSNESLPQVHPVARGAEQEGVGGRGVALRKKADRQHLAKTLPKICLWTFLAVLLGLLLFGLYKLHLYELEEEIRRNEEKFIFFGCWTFVLGPLLFLMALLRFFSRPN